MDWEGFILGIAGLALLEMVVSNPTMAARTGGLAGFPAKIVAAIVDPTVTIWGGKLSAPQAPTSSQGNGPVIPGLPFPTTPSWIMSPLTPFIG